MRSTDPGGWVGVPPTTPIRRVLRRRSVRPRTGPHPVVPAPEPDPTAETAPPPARDADCPFCRLLDEVTAGHWILREEGAAVLRPHAADALAPGHLVIVSDHHTPGLPEAPAGSLAATMLLAQRASRGLRQTLGATGVNLLHSSGADAGQEVPHLHVHLVPRWAEDGLQAWPGTRSRRRAPADWPERLRRSLLG